MNATFWPIFFLTIVDVDFLHVFAFLYNLLMYIVYTCALTYEPIVLVNKQYN